MNPKDSTEGSYAPNKQHLCMELDLNLCPCGCGQVVEGRKDKKYFSRHCKDQIRNKARYEKQKLAVRLAFQVKELMPVIRDLAEEILELHEGKKKGE